MDTHMPETRILSWLECIPVTTQDAGAKCLSYFNLRRCSGWVFFQGNMLLYTRINRSWGSIISQPEIILCCLSAYLMGFTSFYAALNNQNIA